MDLTEAPPGTFTVATDGQPAGVLVQDGSGALVGTGSFGRNIYMTTVGEWASSNAGGTISACLAADVPSAVGVVSNGGSPTVSMNSGELFMDCVRPAGTAPVCTMRDRLEIIADGAVATLRHLRFASMSAHTSGNQYGGAIYLNDGGELNAFHCAFEGNRAPGGFGGAIHVQGSDIHTARLFVDGCSFTSNTARGRGGAISANEGTITITGSIFSSNSYSSSGAGRSNALYIAANCWCCPTLNGRSDSSNTVLPAELEVRSGLYSDEDFSNSAASALTFHDPNGR